MTTPADAAERIRSLAADEDRSRAAAEVMSQMHEQFSDAGTSERLLDVIVGDPPRQEK